MSLHLYRFLMIGEFVVFCVAWICFDGSCDLAAGESKCLGKISDKYINAMSMSKETYYVGRRFLCDVYCFKKRCTCYLYLPDTSCMLVFTDDPPAASANVLRRMGNNVAVGKPATGSSYITTFPPSDAIDGDYSTIFHSNPISSEVITWWQIDLTTAQIIKGIRIIPRLDQTILYRFVDLEIYVSAKDAAIGGPDSGDLVSIITTAPAALGYFWVVGLEDNKDSHQFVIVLRRQTPGVVVVVDFSEVEIIV